MISSFLSEIFSIKVKLFLWFWLIAISSVMSTRLISNYLASEYVAIEPNRKDIHQLQKAVKVIEKIQPIALVEFIQGDNAQSINADITKHNKLDFILKNLILKKLQTSEIVHNAYWRFHPSDEYISEYSFTELGSWQFDRYRVTGPVAIQIHGESYQLFVRPQVKAPRHLGMAFMRLPAWAKLMIPLIISLLCCWLLARTLSRPLSKIEHVVTQLGEGDLTVRVKDLDNRQDELGRLARCFNQMGEKLSFNQTAQKRLLGDVSHELRSPLTRLQMALGLAQQSLEDKSISTETLHKHLARCELEVGRLDDMIGSVLSLSRLENAISQSHFSLCLLTPLITSLIEDAQFIAEKRGIHVRLAIQNDIKISLDSMLFASAISNILNNAVNYSPDNSVIDINVISDGKKTTITVADHGGGVPESALTHLFEPFFRVATARDRISGGTGLGLAISQQAIAAHQGIIFAENNLKGGLTVTVELPNTQKAST